MRARLAAREARKAAKLRDKEAKRQADKVREGGKGGEQGCEIVIAWKFFVFFFCTWK